MNGNVIYLLYDSRSGSTLLANLLVTSYNVLSPPETNFLYHLYQDKLSFQNRWTIRFVLKKDKKFTDLPIGREEFLGKIGYFPTHQNRIAKIFLDSLMQPEVPNLMIKKGNNAFVADHLVSVTPNCHFLCIVRDGRAVYNSKKKSLHSATGRPMTDSVASSANQWVRYMKQFLHLQQKYPQRTLIVRYEELIRASSQVVSMIADFAGLRKREQQESYYIPEKYHKIHANVNKNLNAGRIDAWKEELHRNEISTFNEIASEMLEELNYSL